MQGLLTALHGETGCIRADLQQMADVVRQLFGPNKVNAVFTDDGRPGGNVFEFVPGDWSLTTRMSPHGEATYTVQIPWHGQLPLDKIRGIYFPDLQEIYVRASDWDDVNVRHHVCSVLHPAGCHYWLTWEQGGIFQRLRDKKETKDGYSDIPG